MTAQPSSTPDHPLVTLIEDAHGRALDALDTGRPLDAVVWMSAHLAAAHRALRPVATRQPAAALATRDLRAADRSLERTLRLAEQHYSGDALAAQLDETRLDEALRQALGDHGRAERAVLHHVVDSASEPALADLLTAYASALEHAPTRPHPHAPHRGVLGAAAFHVDAWRDRLMDTMDGRHVPTPRRPQRAVTPGRWGRYLLGEMED
jgi:hypothetical protein